MWNLKLGDYDISQGGALFVIAGPCVLENEETPLVIGREMKALCEELGLPYIFKASFDKANRTSGKSFRGPGLEAGLDQLARIKDELGVPVLTDVHLPEQCAPAAKVCDIIQIPAFLCRQTDILEAASATNACVNVKKGQFLAPWDMRNVVSKLKEFGAKSWMLTERGASFGYNTLVSDMRSIPQMQEFAEGPVVFDATHSVQQPGGQGATSGGNSALAPWVASSAVAIGCDGLFAETHPNPAEAKSDGPNMIPLERMRAVLTRLKAIREASLANPL